MIKKILLLFVAILLVNGCTLFNSESRKIKKQNEMEKKAAIKTEQKRIAKIGQEIQNIREDKNYYFGIGTADIKNEYSLARQKAKERALNELAKSIKMEVSIDMKKTLSNISTGNNASYSEQEKETIEQQSKIYTDLVLRNIRFEKFYEDYPRKGVITSVVKKSVSEYDEMVKKQLSNNKKMINEFIKTANLEFSNGKFLNAIANWQMAQKTSQSIFRGLPLFIDVDNDGVEEEINSYINNRISAFFTNIIFEKNDNTKIFYDAQGKINRNPSFTAYYQDKNGMKKGISFLPLLVSVVEGTAKVLPEIETGQYGQAELTINDIDASYSQTKVKIEINIDKIKKTGSFLAVPTSLNYVMKKMRTIGVAVTTLQNSKLSVPTSVMQSIKAIILRNGFSAVEINFRKENLNSEDLLKIGKYNLDYFLNIFIKVGNAKTVGGYANMFNANCSASASVYQMPIGNIKISEPFDSAKGFGASAQNAQLNAYSKIVENINRKLEEILMKFPK